MLPGLKSDELLSCYSDSVGIKRVFSQMKVMREEHRARETSAEIRGLLVNGKTMPQPGTNLGVLRRLLVQHPYLLRI